jgi:quercetin dioxygenase-like cupin family protein
MKLPLSCVAALALGACVSITVTEETASDETPDCSSSGRVLNAGQITSTPVASQPLANAPGMTLTAAHLTVPPGARSNPHRHAGTVFVYVIKGAVCSQITGDPGLRPYVAGQSFFEPPGSQHLGFTNPGIVTAEVLVTFVADAGATLTAPLQ